MKLLLFFPLSFLPLSYFEHALTTLNDYLQNSSNQLKLLTFFIILKKKFSNVWKALEEKLQNDLEHEKSALHEKELGNLIHSSL